MPSRLLTRKSNVLLYKTVLKAVTTHISKTIHYSNQMKFALNVMETYRALQENRVWRRRYNGELYKCLKESEIVECININRLTQSG